MTEADLARYPELLQRYRAQKAAVLASRSGCHGCQLRSLNSRFVYLLNERVKRDKTLKKQ